MLRPDSSDAVRGLAALALEQQDYDEAYELHRRLIEMGEHGPRAALQRRPDLPEARRATKTRLRSTSRRSPKIRSSPRPC